MLNLVIIGDSQLDRAKIKDLIHSFNDLNIKLIGECENINEAAYLIHKNTIDIIINVVDYPIINELKSAENINSKTPNTKIIFYSPSDKLDYTNTDTFPSGCINIKVLNSNELLKYLTNAAEEIKSQIELKKHIPTSILKGNLDLNEMQNNIKLLLYSDDTFKIKEYVKDLFKDYTVMPDKTYITNLCFSVIMCTVSLLSDNNENSNILPYDSSLSWQSLLSLENTADAHNLIENLLISINKYLSSKTDTKYSIIANQIKKFIKKNYLKNISVNTIADKLDYSPNYISYIFKQSFAQNISDYITELKISKAKEQLMDLNNKIYFISETLGFSNTSYFCSVFKKYTGLTPKEYRENHMF